MFKRFNAQIATNKHEATLSDSVTLLNADETQRVCYLPTAKNFQCPIRRMVCQAKALLALRGEGRPQAPTT